MKWGNVSFYLYCPLNTSWSIIIILILFVTHMSKYFITSASCWAVQSKLIFCFTYLFFSLKTSLSECNLDVPRSSFSRTILIPNYYSYDKLCINVMYFLARVWESFYFSIHFKFERSLEKREHVLLKSYSYVRV